MEQRQIFVDAPAFAPALDQAIEDDAEVLALTDLGDAETAAMALAAAERSLIICRITAIDPEDAIRKITDFFPPTEQGKIRTRLASNLAGIIAVTGLESVVGTGSFPATAVIRVEDELRKILGDPAQTYLLAERLEVNSSSTHSLSSSIEELYKHEIISKSVAERHLTRAAPAGSVALPDISEQSA